MLGDADSFLFTSDTSQFLAQQLIANSLQPQPLRHLEEVYSSLLNVSLADKHMLDCKLTASFRNISNSTSWQIVEELDGGETIGGECVFVLDLNKSQGELLRRNVCKDSYSNFMSPIE